MSHAHCAFVASGALSCWLRATDFAPLGGSWADLIVMARKQPPRFAVAVAATRTVSTTEPSNTSGSSDSPL